MDYVEKMVPTWFVFGSYPNGNVDVSDGDRDIVANVTPATAERLMMARTRFYDEVRAIMDNAQTATG